MILFPLTIILTGILIIGILAYLGMKGTGAI
jgi:hypothetical protein